MRSWKRYSDPNSKFRMEIRPRPALLLQLRPEVHLQLRPQRPEVPPPRPALHLQLHPQRPEVLPPRPEVRLLPQIRTKPPAAVRNKYSKELDHVWESG